MDHVRAEALVAEMKTQGLNSKSAGMVLVATVLVFLGTALAQKPNPLFSNDKPLFEVDVRKFGYEKYSDKKFVRPIQILLDFTDASHLALAWALPASESAAKKAGQSSLRPAHLHVLLLDTKAGSKSGEGQWSMPSRFFSFFGLRDGKFLTCTGNTLRLFSATFEVVHEETLSGDISCSHFGPAFGISPSRRSLLLSRVWKGSRQMELRDAETFAVVSKWIEKSETTTGISDRWIVGLCGQPPSPCLRDIEQSWRPLHVPWKNGPEYFSRAGPAEFANNDTLIVEGKLFAVATVQGALLFSADLPKDRFVTSVRPSGGDRFAAIESRMRGLKIEPLDMYPFRSDDSVVVYSISGGRAIYKLKLEGTSPWTPWAIHANDIAVSPDGTLLAIVSEGILKVYGLPQ
jgi:hypothetical protein